MSKSRANTVANKYPRWAEEFPELLEEYLALVSELRRVIRLTHGLETRVSEATGIQVSRISVVLNGHTLSLLTALRIARALEGLGVWDKRVTLRIVVDDGQGNGHQASA